MRAGGIFHDNGHARPRELYKIVNIWVENQGSLSLLG
jgi:hypothetical protein